MVEVPFVSIHEITECPKYCNNVREQLLSFPEFFGLLPNEIIDIANTDKISLNELVEMVCQSGYYRTGTDAIQLAKTLLFAPDSIVSFENVTISHLDKFKNMIDYTSRLNKEKKASFIKKKMSILIPLFLRLNIKEIPSPEYLLISNLVNETIPGHPLSLAFQLMLIIHIIQHNIQNDEVISHCVEKSIQCIDSILKSEEYTIILLPYILPTLAEILFLSLPFCFSENMPVSGNRYKLIHLIPSLFLHIAMAYPASFKKVPFQSLLHYFYRFPDRKSDLSPPYEFLLKYPEYSYTDQFAHSISALVNSFVLLYQLSVVNDNLSINIILTTLIKFCSGSRNNETSTLRQLYNTSLYPMYEPIFSLYQKLLSEGHQCSISLYLLISNYNYSDLFNKFEKKFNLSSTIPYNLKFYPEIQSITLINSNTIDNITSIFDVIRLTDGFLLLDDFKLANIINNTHFALFLTKYLVSLMKSGNPLLDIRMAVPFAKLSLDYMKLHLKMRPPKSQAALGMNILFVLSLYNNIILSAPPLLDKKQYITPIIAEIYIIRKEFARIVSKYSPYFFVTGFLQVKTRCISLLDPLLFLLSDVLWYTPDIKNLHEISQSLKEFLPQLLLTGSILLFNVIKNILYYLGHDITDIIQTLYNIYQNDNNKDKQTQSIIQIRILALLSYLSSSPEIKLTILNHKNISEFVKLALSNISTQVASEKMIWFACDFLLNLTSPSLTLNPSFDFEYRCATECIPYDCIGQFVTTITNFLKENYTKASIVTINSVLNLLRYSAENFFIIQAIRDLKIELHIQDFLDTELVNNDDFIAVYVEFALIIAQADNMFCRSMIGYDIDNTILDNENLMRAERISDLKLQIQQSCYYEPSYKLSSIQRYCASKSSLCMHGKFKKVDSPLLPHMNLNYLKELTESDFGEVCQIPVFMF